MGSITYWSHTIFFFAGIRRMKLERYPCLKLERKKLSSTIGTCFYRDSTKFDPGLNLHTWLKRWNSCEFFWTNDNICWNLASWFKFLSYYLNIQSLKCWNISKFLVKLPKVNLTPWWFWCRCGSLFASPSSSFSPRLCMCYAIGNFPKVSEFLR